ncbi:MAG TPA: hypothetical protein VHK70_08490 [Burkholderiaceae bacterium]|jgi:hypothetical protein|nr:hypothetical protein [Burkholderiaceae bacterium]
MLKFEFSIQTREGQKLGRIAIMGRDRPDVERKLYQMYRQCKILRCEVYQERDRRWQAMSTMEKDVEEPLAALSKEN